MDRDMQIAERIRAWRHALGLTQDEFAKRAGIPKRTLVGYENSEREPGAAALSAIAKTGCNMTWLLTGEGEMLAQTRASIDDATRLKIAIEAVEEWLAPRRLELSPYRKAELILACYELIDGTSEGKDKVVRLLKLVG